MTSRKRLIRCDNAPFVFRISNVNIELCPISASCSCASLHGRFPHPFCWHLWAVMLLRAMLRLPARVPSLDPVLRVTSNINIDDAVYMINYPRQPREERNQVPSYEIWSSNNMSSPLPLVTTLVYNLCSPWSCGQKPYIHRNSHHKRTPWCLHISRSH